MNNIVWTTVQMLFIVAVVVLAERTGAYWMLAIVLGIFAGNFVAIRLGNLGLATTPFSVAIGSVAVLSIGVAALPSVPSILSIGLATGGIYAALIMAYRYGDANREWVD